MNLVYAAGERVIAVGSRWTLAQYSAFSLSNRRENVNSATIFKIFIWGGISSDIPRKKKILNN